jgi:hypothetical protein
MTASSKTVRAASSARRPAAKARRVLPAKKRKPRAVAVIEASRPAADASKTVKHAKSHGKPVRDSFTMPQADFALIALLKERALASRREAKKSELLRAGLHALAALDAAGLVAALGRLQPIKVGRPRKGH